MTNALVLAGHGSHISPLTAGIVWQQADSLRALGVADEVTAAFWKETPSFATVLNTLVADDITIMPLFTAQGYFTRTVIPAEMELEGRITTRAGRTIRYARTLGEHPFIKQMVRKRVVETLQLIDASPLDIGVALIGHGTKRNPQSRTATEAQVDVLRAEMLVGETVAVYLDDTPSIPEAYALLRTPIIIAVPNFLSLGSHTTIDIPQALGLKAGETRGEVDGRAIYYTDPVGLDDSLSDVILELAHEAGATLHSPTSGSAWNSFPAAGRDDLLEVVEQQGQLHFGQLILTPSEVQAEGLGSVEFKDVNSLRDYVRRVPCFRPLATTTDLPGGWRVPVNNSAQLHAVVETVYPGAVADWAAGRRGTLSTHTLREVTARQHGMFRALTDFHRADNMVKRVCGGCVRHASWFNGATPSESIPCVEACNLWMSKAVEIDE